MSTDKDNQLVHLVFISSHPGTRGRSKLKRHHTSGREVHNFLEWISAFWWAQLTTMNYFLSKSSSKYLRMRTRFTTVQLLHHLYHRGGKIIQYAEEANNTSSSILINTRHFISWTQTHLVACKYLSGSRAWVNQRTFWGSFNYFAWI